MKKYQLKSACGKFSFLLHALFYFASFFLRRSFDDKFVAEGIIKQDIQDNKGKLKVIFA